MIKRITILTFLMAFVNLYICPFSLARQVIVENGTRVRLKLANKVSSKINNEGETISFIVCDDIKLGDTVLIKEGTEATGCISELIANGSIGKAAKLVITLDNTKAVDGSKVPLTGTITKKGEERLLFSAILSIFLTPLFLLVRGTETHLPAGYLYQARVDKDTIVSLEDNFIPVTNKK